ncbi:hypothetical protein BWI96_09565 [Siphonobacter sp. SORGH_AS_0500]|uniref:hypothetical protein n=1 Tax=Siphonobacter sp. SORGH_AS_0500 TaxID=1864824 RepID=UPI000CC75793|nr:hypothetical protein [Siphonobacter sp. SORGH_AS_0500]PKK36627.1 hypothetical protein BWI96_09565 [Siphonobacter sp. SORGH_AS_0500]
MKTRLLLFLIMASLSSVKAQVSFGKACLGKWEGMMRMYQKGQLKDSVKILLTVAETQDPQVWLWKTEYLSTKHPAVKDYTLKIVDESKGHYVIDEGDGTALPSYRFENKLFSLFETEGITLTSTYELKGDELVFEVTSGKKGSVQPVTTFSVDYLQKALLKRQ